MPDSTTSSPRRDFLGGLAATAAAIGLGDLIPGAQAADTGAGTAFQSWLDSIPGKYRQVYDAPAPNNGFALIWSHVEILLGSTAFVRKAGRGTVGVTVRGPELVPLGPYGKAPRDATRRRETLRRAGKRLDVP